LLTERVLGAVFGVSNTPGASVRCSGNSGFLVFGLRLKCSFRVTYKGYYVREYFADILVEDELVIELKCVERLLDEHTGQCLNYLRASGRTVCLLVNLQRPKVEWQRVVQGFQSAEPMRTPAAAEC
jgi:hypothetical protein